MYLNKATIIGNLTRDPELKALPSGTNVVNMSIATNRVWKDANGVKQEEVEYHNIVAFGKTADLVAQYLKKGSQALIEGRIQTRSWDDKETGKKAYRTEIVADSVQFGSKPGGAKAPGTAAPTAPAEEAPKSAEEVIEGMDKSINVDDIPF